MICYDREFPESARVLMLGGAELILTPNACALDVDRLGQFRARAYENMVGVAMATYATPTADHHGNLAPLDVCNGHSVAFSGVKFDREGNVLDHKLVEAGEGEELVIATFDLDALRAYRADEIGGDAYRKPAVYRALSMTPRCRCSTERTVAGRRSRAHDRPGASDSVRSARARRAGSGPARPRP